MSLRSLACLAVLVLSTSSSASAAAAADGAARARAAIEKRFPTVRVGDFRATPLTGMYQFTVGVDVFYTDGEGRFVLRGDLIDFQSDRNLSEERRSELRLLEVAGVPESQMITYGPADARHTITVFTDIDCGYCRRLHQDMAVLNANSVRVRYLFYPRAGQGSESWQKAVDVWCAKDRRSALTDAKAGKAVPRSTCSDAPIARHYQLGERLKLPSWEEHNRPAIEAGLAEVTHPR
jgi:thiol:disulfide interchange protein DsbC